MPRFLITDDDDITHTFLRHVLISLGDVTHAFSGREAVESCGMAARDGDAFDYVFLDALLPGMEEDNTIQAIRDIHGREGLPTPRFIACGLLGPARRPVDTPPDDSPDGWDGSLRNPFEPSSVLSLLAGFGLAGAPDGLLDVPLDGQLDGQLGMEDRGEDFW